MIGALPELAIGALGGGGGVLALVAAVVKGREGREETFNKRVDARLEVLEAAVKECEKERPYMLLMAGGMKMLVIRLQEKDPKDPLIQQVANAFRALPTTENQSLTELVEQLNQVPYSREGEDMLRDAYRRCERKEGE